MFYDESIQLVLVYIWRFTIVFFCLEKGKYEKLNIPCYVLLAAHIIGKL